MGLGARARVRAGVRVGVGSQGCGHTGLGSGSGSGSGSGLGFGLEHLEQIPLGPRLEDRTSCSPRAALMFIMAAAPFLTTSAFGFTSWAAAAMVSLRMRAGRGGQGAGRLRAIHGSWEGCCAGRESGRGADAREATRRCACWGGRGGVAMRPPSTLPMRRSSFAGGLSAQVGGVALGARQAGGRATAV